MISAKSCYNKEQNIHSHRNTNTCLYPPQYCPLITNCPLRKEELIVKPDRTPHWQSSPMKNPTPQMHVGAIPAVIKQLAPGKREVQTSQPGLLGVSVGMLAFVLDTLVVVSAGIIGILVDGEHVADGLIADVHVTAGGVPHVRLGKGDSAQCTILGFPMPSTTLTKLVMMYPVLSPRLLYQIIGAPSRCSMIIDFDRRL